MDLCNSVVEVRQSSNGFILPSKESPNMPHMFGRSNDDKWKGTKSGEPLQGCKRRLSCCDIKDHALRQGVIRLHSFQYLAVTTWHAQFAVLPSEADAASLGYRPAAQREDLQTLDSRCFTRSNTLSADGSALPSKVNSQQAADSS